MVVFGPKWLYRAKEVVIGQKWLSSGKSGCIRESGSFRAKWMYKGKTGCIRTKVVVFGEKLLYSGKVVVFGEKRGCTGCY